MQTKRVPKRWKNEIRRDGLYDHFVAISLQRTYFGAVSPETTKFAKTRHVQ
jgi:hypothetical protein